MSRNRITRTAWRGYLLADPIGPTPVDGPEHDQQGIWSALEREVAPYWREHFMFMGLAKQGPDIIYRYKHRDTREYLNIDLHGGFYAYRSGAYVRISRDAVMSELLPQWAAINKRNGAVARRETGVCHWIATR